MVSKEQWSFTQELFTHPVVLMMSFKCTKYAKFILADSVWLHITMTADHLKHCPGSKTFVSHPLFVSNVIFLFQNGANMAFAIISSCITFVQFIIYCVAVTYFREYYRICSGWGYSYHCSSSSNSTGVAIYVILLLLMIAEFAISLCVAIYCCKYGCQGCCDNTTTGVRSL